MIRDGHAIAALVVIGLIQMAWHLVKTWNLVVNGRGWYDAP